MIFVIAVFRIIQTLSVMLIVFRMLKYWQRNQILSEQALTKIGTALFWMVFVVLAFPFSQEHWRWLVLVVLLSITHFSCEYLVFQREIHFCNQWINYLDRMLARIRTGKTLRTALKMLEEEEEGFFRAKLAQIRSYVVFLQHTEMKNQRGVLVEIVHELRAIDQQQHQSLTRLKNLRRKLSVEFEFRRRSGQVLYQIRLQAWILTGLYLALLVFVLIRDGTNLDLEWVVLSLFLFGMGLIWLSRMGRGVKWKV